MINITGSLGKWGIIHTCRLENSTAEGSSTPIVAIGVSVAQLCDDQDEQAAKLSDLSDEMIEVARAWMRLPEGKGGKYAWPNNYCNPILIKYGVR